MVTDYFAKMPSSKCMYLHDIIVEVSKALPHIDNLIIMTVMYVFIKLVYMLINFLAQIRKYATYNSRKKSRGPSIN